MLITLELIKGASSHTKLRRQETLQEFLKRITHLHLNGKHISKISSLDECVNLEVLYLYDNEIKAIESLNSLSKLTNLYLQDNQISSISQLEHLSALQTLSLDRNRITTVAGLQSLENLAELYISGQKGETPIPQQISFDENTLSTLSRTLISLHCASNNISHLHDIAQLKCLTYLDLSQNNISDLEELKILFTNCTRLNKLILKGNPICKKREYKEFIILNSSPSLAMLDDKEITSNERVFLEKKASTRGKNTPPSSPAKSTSSRSREGGIKGSSFAT